MKATLLLIIFCLFTLSAFAQTKEVWKVDEFLHITCEDLKARLDYFAIAINEEPKSIGYAVIYEGRYSKNIYDRKGNAIPKKILPTFGESVSFTQLMQKYIFKFRRFSQEKLIFIDGGFRENFTVEFWLVPDGAKLPKPTPTLETMKYRKGAPLKIDCVE